MKKTMKHLVLTFLLILLLTILSSCGLKDNTLVIVAEDIVYGEDLAITANKNLSGASIMFEYKHKDAKDDTYTTTAPTDAGLYTVRATTAETKKYKKTSVTYDFEIQKADAIININDIPTEYAYTGSSQSISGATGSGTITYSDNSFKNIGDFTVTINVAESANYKSGSQTIDISVIKATYNMSGIAFSNATYTYDGEEKSLVITGALPEGVSVEYTQNKLTNADTLEVTATFVVNEKNYNTIPPKKATLKINKADAIINLRDILTEFDYNGSAQSISGATGSGTITYENNSFTNAGIYTVTVKVAETNNYKSASQQVEVTVNKIDYDLTGIIFESTSYVYDGDTKSLLVLGTMPEGIQINCEGNGINTNVGDYTITAKFIGDDTNYNPIPDRTATLSIIKAVPQEVVFPTESTSLVYGQRLSESELIGGSGDGTFIWQNANTVFGVSTTSQTVLFLPNDESNYDYFEVQTEMDLAIEIQKALLTVTAEEKTFVYGDNMLFTFEISGYKNEETFGVLTSVPLFINTYQNVGEYIDGILFYGAEASNYYFEYIPATLTINQKPLETPIININGDYLEWQNIPFASKYQIVIGEEEIDYSGNVFLIPVFYQNSPYKAKVKAITTNTNFINSESIEITKLATPENLMVSNGAIVWNAVDGAISYQLYVDSVIVMVSTNSYSLQAFAEGTYSVKVLAKGNSADIKDSNLTTTIDATKLSNDFNIRIENNIIVWDEIFNSGGYTLNINDVTKDFEQGVTSYDAKDAPSGELDIYVYAKGNNEYIRSNNSANILVTKLNIVSSINYEFNYARIEWSVEDDADLFIIMLDDEEIITTDTFFEFGEEFDAGTYLFKVRATKDDNAYIYSDFSQVITLTKLEIPTNFRIEDGLLKWDSVELATNYMIGVFQNQDIDFYGIFDETQFDTKEITVEGNIEIYLLSFNEIDYNFPSNTYISFYNALAIPTIIGNQNGVITWNEVENNAGYTVEINGQEFIVADESLIIDETYSAGTYNIKIRAISDSVDCLSSGYCEAIEIKKLASPANLAINNGKIEFDQVEDSIGYVIKISDGQGYPAEFFTEETSYHIPQNYTGPYDNLEIKVLCFGKGLTILDSEVSLAITATLIQTPSLSIINGNLTWQRVDNATGYLIYINGEEKDIGDVTSYSLGSDYEEGSYSISIRAKGDNFYISSLLSQEIVATKLASPIDLSLDEGVLTWTLINNATSYRLSIDEQQISINGGINLYNVEHHGDLSGKIISIKALSNNGNLNSNTIYFHVVGESLTHIYNDLIYYEFFDSNTKVRILGLKDKSITELVVPEYIEDLPVRQIVDEAFADCSNLKSVVLLDCSIGLNILSGANSLEEITLAFRNGYLGYYFGAESYEENSEYVPQSLKIVNVLDGITYISNNVFYGCNSLEQVNLPDTIISIGKEAFAYCSKLTGMILPSSVQIIDEKAFAYCSNLTSIVLPESVISIGKEAFIYCRALLNFEMTENMTTVGIEILKGCASLETLTVPFKSIYNESNNSYLSYYFGGTDYNSGEMIPISLKDIYVSSGVTAIPENAFRNSLYIETVFLPESVTTLGNAAFRNCNKLINVDMGQNIITIGDYAFHRCYDLQELLLPAALGHIGAYAFSEITSNIIFDEEAVITSISASSFRNYFGTETILPESIESIGDYAYSGCKNLLSLEIPLNVVEIGSYAFMNCTNLTTLIIPINVTFIGESVFSGLVAEIVFETKITIIPVGLFSGYEGREIYLEEGVTEIGAYAFRNCKNITSIVIPSTVGIIGESAFSGCASLVSIIFAQIEVEDGGEGENGEGEDGEGEEEEEPAKYSLTEIGDSAFWGCNNIESIDLPETLVSIGNNLLTGCTSLTSLSAPFKNSYSDTTNSYLRYFFGGTSYKTGIKVPETLTTVTIVGKPTAISDYAFWGCDKLQNIDIPDSVTSIGDKAFENCKGITELYISKNVEYIGESVLKGCDALVSLSAPLKQSYNPNNNSYLKYYFGATAYDDEVNLPQTLQEVIITSKNVDIANYSFYGCEQLLDIVLPEELTSIGNRVFESCYGLTTISIPKSVNDLGEFAFFNVVADIIIESESQLPQIGPNVFNGYRGKLISTDAPITDIAAYAFYDCINLEVLDLSIKSSITNIGEYAFYNCEKLEYLFLSDKTIDSIGEYAFYGCKDLVSIDLQSSTIKAIGEYAFYECESLASIATDDSILSVGDYAFYNCMTLTDISLKNKNATFGKNILSGCTSINTLTVPLMASYDAYNNSYLRYYFGGTSYKKGGLVPSSLTEVTIIGDPIAISDYAFYGISSITTISLPDTITKIGKDAFYDCSSLININIPESVYEIGLGALAGTQWYNYQPDGVVYAGNVLYSFKGAMTTNTRIKVRTSTKGISARAFYNQTNLTDINIGANVTNIGEKAFFGCEGLSNIVLPISLQKIGDNAFAYCTTLSSIIITESVQEIGQNTFYGCSNLSIIQVEGNNQNYMSEGGILFNKTKTELIKFPASFTGDYALPTSVTKISDGAFEGCKNMAEIEITENVTTIGEYAFENVTANVIFTNNTISQIGSYAFANYMGESITIPQSVLSIGQYAFSGAECEVLFEANSIIEEIGINAFRNYAGESIALPEGVTKIGISAFAFSVNLSEIILPNSLEIVGRYAFQNTKWLSEKNDGIVYANKVVYTYKGTMQGIMTLTLSSNAISISDYAFAWLGNLGDIVLPSGLKYIGDGAFYMCYNLTEIDIPRTIESIGDKAFFNCSNLRRITVSAETPPRFNENALNLVHTSFKIYVPSASLDAYKVASGWDSYETRFTSMPRIIFNTNGGEAMGPINVTYNKAIRTLEEPTKEENEFIGWYIDEALQSTYNLDTIITADITLYASWSVNQYTITFETNGATAIPPMVLDYNSSLLIIEDPTKEGYEFAGWYNDEALTELFILTTMPAGDFTLYADWGTEGLVYTLINEGTEYSVSQGASYDKTDIRIPIRYNGKLVTAIDSYGFNNNTDLLSIIIPMGVMGIGHYALIGCTNLTSITFKSETPPYLGLNPLATFDNLSIYVPSEAIDEYKYFWSQYSNIIFVIP